MNLPRQLLNYDELGHILDPEGFGMADVPNTLILVGWADKLPDIQHWADAPGQAYREISEEDQVAIARRLAACWNALRRFSTEELEGMVVIGIITAPENAERPATEAVSRPTETIGVEENTDSVAQPDARDKRGSGGDNSDE